MEEVLKSVREVEEKGLKLSRTEGGHKGNTKVIALCSFVEEKFQGCSNREAVGLATSVETTGVDLKTRQTCQKESRLSEEFFEYWCEEAAEVWSLRGCGEVKPLALRPQKG